MNRALSRQIDRDAVEILRIPSLVLMENAARGIVEHLMPMRDPSDRIVILCGPGNNGGDGLAAARQLAALGINSQVISFTAGKSLSADAQANFDMLASCRVPVHSTQSVQSVLDLLDSLSETDWILDCLLGTGVRGTVRAPFDALIRGVNASAARVLAVDVPSGMDCDTGHASLCVVADDTVTFVAAKVGFGVPGALRYTGSVTVKHIGIPCAWVEEWVSVHSNPDRDQSADAC